MNFRIRKSLGGVNNVYLGLGFTLFQSNVNSISGWTAEVLNTEKIKIPFLSFQLGHIYNLKSTDKFKFSLDNNVEVTKNAKFGDYNLKKTNLIWRPGLTVEKNLSQKTFLSLGINYGIGLINLSENDNYQLRNNVLGVNLGIRKQL